jgi:hypothetical protein
MPLLCMVTSSCYLTPLSCSLPPAMSCLFYAWSLPVISCFFLVHFHLSSHAFLCSLPLSSHASFFFLSSCQLMPHSCSLPLSSHAYFLFTFSCHLMPLLWSLPPVISCLFCGHFLLSSHASFLFTSTCQLMPLSCSLPPVISCFFLFTSSCHLMPLLWALPPVISCLSCPFPVTSFFVLVHFLVSTSASFLRSNS